MRENKTKYIILGLLSHEPLTGYDIRRTAERSIGNFWTDISYGQIYPTLGTLEKQGLISKVTKIEGERRLRKVYSVTQTGLSELRRWLEEPSDPEVFKFDILLKLYFGARTGIEHSRRNIRAFRERNERLLETYGAFERGLRAVLNENIDHHFMLLTLLFGQHLVRAQLNWAEEALRTLESIGEKADSSVGGDKT